MYAYSQGNVLSEENNISATADDTIVTDSLLPSNGVPTEVTLNSNQFIPNPTKAVVYSAIFPGLGQIYNRKYWKLPLIYGGALGCAYAISWNHKTYVGYRDAYKDIMDHDPNTNSWLDYTNNPNVSSESLGPLLKRRRDYYRRYRDLSCIIAVGLYVVCMIDAYVDAHLFDYNISEDLSMQVNPVVFEKTAMSSYSVGFRCSFAF